MRHRSLGEVKRVRRRSAGYLRGSSNYCTAAYDSLKSAFERMRGRRIWRDDISSCCYLPTVVPWDVEKMSGGEQLA